MSMISSELVVVVHDSVEQHDDVAPEPRHRDGCIDTVVRPLPEMDSVRTDRKRGRAAIWGGTHGRHGDAAIAARVSSSSRAASEESNGTDRERRPGDVGTEESGVVTSTEPEKSVRRAL